MNAVRFSVVIPTYNRAHKILSSVRSVLDQSFPNLEVIVVDDGSTDNTKTVLETIKDPRLVYVYQDNAERSAARNKGIETAQGEYICFLDSDDLYLSDHLSNMDASIVQAKDPKAVFVSGVILKQGTKETKMQLPSDQVLDIDMLWLKPVNPTRVCIHRDLLQAHRFMEEVVIVEDTVLLTELLDAGAAFHLVDSYEVVYDQDDESSVSLTNNSYKIRLKSLHIFMKSRPELIRRLPKGMMDHHLSMCYFRMAEYDLHQGAFFPMLYKLFRSFLLEPFSARNKERLYFIWAGIVGKTNTKETVA